MPQQFRDNYSGALLFTPTAEEKQSKETLDEARKVLDEIKQERQLLQKEKEVHEDAGNNTTKQNSD